MDTLNQTLGLSDAALLSAAGSIFLPLLVSFFQRQTWNDTLRVLMAYFVYFVYTGLTVWFLNAVVFDDNTNAKTIVHAFLLVALVAYTSFKTVWQPRGTTVRLEASVNNEA